MLAFATQKTNSEGKIKFADSLPLLSAWEWAEARVAPYEIVFNKILLFTVREQAVPFHSSLRRTPVSSLLLKTRTPMFFMSCLMTKYSIMRVTNSCPAAMVDAIRHRLASEGEIERSVAPKRNYRDISYCSEVMTLHNSWWPPLFTLAALIARISVIITGTDPSLTAARGIRRVRDRGRRERMGCKPQLGDSGLGRGG